MLGNKKQLQNSNVGQDLEKIKNQLLESENLEKITNTNTPQKVYKKENAVPEYKSGKLQPEDTDLIVKKTPEGLKDRVFRAKEQTEKMEKVRENRGTKEIESKRDIEFKDKDKAYEKLAYAITPVFDLSVTEKGPVKEFRKGEEFSINKIVSKKDEPKKIESITYRVIDSHTARSGVELLKCAIIKDGKQIGKKEFDQKELKQYWDKDMLRLAHGGSFSASLDDMRRKAKKEEANKTGENKKEIKSETTEKTVKKETIPTVPSKPTVVIEDKKNPELEKIAISKRIFNFGKVGHGAYTVELPSKKENRYTFTHESGKPVYHMTEDQLLNALKEKTIGINLTDKEIEEYNKAHPVQEIKSAKVISGPKEPMVAKKIETEGTLEEKIIEILKNNKISEVIVSAGNKKIKSEKQTNFINQGKVLDPENTELSEVKFGDFITTFGQDLDSQTALYLLNYFNKRPPEEIYNEGAKSTIIDIRKGEMEPKEKVKGIRIFLDAGGSWLKIEKDGETTTLRIDHHGTGRRQPTSGTKMMYEMMEKAGLLKEKPEWLNKFVKFVNEFDNLTYLENKDQKGNRTFNENYFRNKWPNSLYAIAEKIPYDSSTKEEDRKPPFKTLIELIKTGIIKDPSVPFTQEELEGELGKTKVGEFTIAELCKKSRDEDVEQTITGIKNADKLENTSLGRVVYQNFKKIKDPETNELKTNIIPNNRAFIGTKARGYDTFMSWSKNKNNKTFFINSNHPNLKKVIQKLNEVDPGCALDIRGVMVKGTINTLTERQFLDIIKNPDISIEIKNKEPLKVSAEKKEPEPTKAAVEPKKAEVKEEENKKTEEVLGIEKRIKDLESKIAELMKGMPNENLSELKNFEKFYTDMRENPTNPELLQVTKTGDKEKIFEVEKKLYEEFARKENK